VVLDHVAQGPGVIVIAGAALQGDRLVPDDLHPLDVLGVPDGLEDPVGEPQPEDVLDGLQAQEVVGPEGRRLPEAAAQELVEGACLGQVAPERLLHHHQAAVREPDRGQRLDRRGEGRRRQGQVGDDEALGLVERAGQGGCVAGLGPLVAGHGGQGLSRPRVHRRRVAFQLGGEVAAEGGGVPVLAGHAHNGERLGQPAGLLQMGEGGQQVAAGQVSGGPKDQQLVDHAASLGAAFPAAGAQASSQPNPSRTTASSRRTDHAWCSLAALAGWQVDGGTGTSLLAGRWRDGGGCWSGTRRHAAPAPDGAATAGPAAPLARRSSRVGARRVRVPTVVTLPDDRGGNQASEGQIHDHVLAGNRQPPGHRLAGGGPGHPFTRWGC
jgi:hypothetical protein